MPRHLTPDHDNLLLRTSAADILAVQKRYHDQVTNCRQQYLDMLQRDHGAKLMSTCAATHTYTCPSEHGPQTRKRRRRRNQAACTQWTGPHTKLIMRDGCKSDFRKLNPNRRQRRKEDYIQDQTVGLEEETSHGDIKKLPMTLMAGGAQGQKKQIRWVPGGTLKSWRDLSGNRQCLRSRLQSPQTWQNQ